jgi:hypothetical protein
VSDGATLNGSRSLTERRRNNRVREQVLSAGEEAMSCAFPANDVGRSNAVKHPPNLDRDRVWPREENESRDNSESSQHLPSLQRRPTWGEGGRHHLL